MELYVLEQFREDINPTLGTVNSLNIETLSKEEVLAQLRQLSVDGLHLCRLGNIDPSREELCKILHFAIKYTVERPGTSSSAAGSSGAGSEQPPIKRQKVEDKSPSVKKLQEKIESLAKQLEEKKKEDEASDFERIKREARDEAAKGVFANLDVLHQKLVLLESTAAKINHKSKAEIAFLLGRFQHNKYMPAFATKQVLEQLSSKEEEAILQKEAKLWKHFTMSSAFPPRQWQPEAMAVNAYAYGPGMMPPFHLGQRMPSPVRPRMGQPKGSGLCFRCKRPGHLIRDCPN